MAPTSTKPTAKSITKPVIGSRPGATKPNVKAPKGSLIGKDGVARPSAKPATNQSRNITRMPPKVKSGGDALNRAVIRSASAKPAPTMNPGAIRSDVKRLSKRRDEADAITSDGPLDAFWTAPETVPGVITSRPVSADNTVPPASILCEPTPVDETTSQEHATVERLATPVRDTQYEESELWSRQDAGPGVIRSGSRPRKSERVVIKGLE